MVKKLLGILLVVGLLVGAGIWYVKTNLDSIVKSELERYGSRATRTDVTIDSVKISLRTGEGTVSGISVGNPKAYIAATAIDVGSVNMKLDTSTVTGKGPVVINEITIDRPYITYEVNAQGNNNLKELQRNVSGVSSSSSSGSSKESRRVIIKHLYIRDGKVMLTQSLVKGKDVSAPLPLIHLRDIGKPGVGATGTEVAKQVVSSLSREAANVGSRQLVNQIGSDALNKNVDKLGGKLKGLFGN